MKPHWSWFSDEEFCQEITQELLSKLYIKCNQEPPTYTHTPPQKACIGGWTRNESPQKDGKWLDKETLSWATNFPCSSCQRRRNTNVRNFQKRMIWHKYQRSLHRVRDGKYTVSHTVTLQKKQEMVMAWLAKYSNFCQLLISGDFSVFAPLSITAIFSPLPLPSLILAISKCYVENCPLLHLSIHVLFVFLPSYHLCED